MCQFRIGGDVIGRARTAKYPGAVAIQPASNLDCTALHLSEQGDGHLPVLQALDDRREIAERERRDTGAEDDPKAYLVAIKRLATTASWPQEYWASQLDSGLTGKAGHPLTSEHQRGKLIKCASGTARYPSQGGRPAIVRPHDSLAQPPPENRSTAGGSHSDGTVLSCGWQYNPNTLEASIKLAEDYVDSLTSSRARLLASPASPSSWGLDLHPISPQPITTPPTMGPGLRPPR
ncbi:UNVERIFIED_CONTAM: hypothetical protein FKN15_034926 [Acipenser sinensis]